MDFTAKELFDMDHVVTDDGKIYRVLGNFESPSQFFGLNLYSPNPAGDRRFRGRPYSKNYIEERGLHTDVLDTYDIVEKKRIIEYFEPIEAAKKKSASFKETVWFNLYEKLVGLFGEDNVGMFGSALPGLHLNNSGQIKNDVDFFIEGLENVSKLSQHLREVREDLGFTDYDTDTANEICQNWGKVIRNPNNTFERIMDRRWSGMQLRTETGKVLNTFRFRDTKVKTKFDLIERKNIIECDVVLAGTVLNAEYSNLYPRHFCVNTGDKIYDVYSMWWKFSSPVANGDTVTICGNSIAGQSHDTLLLTNYMNHWIQIRQ